MSKVVNFLGNSGSVIAKRRKTVKGANHRRRAEVKQYNPFIEMRPSQSEPANKNNYGSVIICNIAEVINTPSGHTECWSSWYPHLLMDPSEGTKEYERIGNQYFLKYLRFKGYVNCHGNVHMAINWRLVLVRVTENIFTSSIEDSRMDQYGSLFKNWEKFDGDTQTLDTWRTAARHNYHKKIVDTYKKDLASRKVIASGSIPVNQKRDQIGAISAGEMAGWTRGNIISIPYGEDFKLIPLDIKVVCNDWIKVGEVRYYLVLETDQPLGAHVSNISSSGTGDVSLTKNWEDREMDLNLFCRAYFIDP